MMDQSSTTVIFNRGSAEPHGSASICQGRRRPLRPSCLDKYNNLLLPTNS